MCILVFIVHYMCILVFIVHYMCIPAFIVHYMCIPAFIVHYMSILVLQLLMFIAYIVASAFTSVFHMAVDTIFICFCKFTHTYTQLLTSWYVWEDRRVKLTSTMNAYNTPTYVCMQWTTCIVTMEWTSPIS